MYRIALVAWLLPAMPVLAGSLPVSGSATVKANPDEVRISARMASPGSTAALALAYHKQRMQWLRDGLGKQGIDAQKDLQPTNLRIVPEYTTYEYEWYDSSESKTLITGYTVQQSFSICLRDPAKTAATLDLLVRQGIKEVDHVSFRAKDHDALVDQALKLAVKDAQRKAKLLAEAAGVQIIKIDRIQETSASAAHEYKPGQARQAAARLVAADGFNVRVVVEITYQISDPIRSTVFNTER